MNVLYCGDDEKAKLYILGSLEYLGFEAQHVAPESPFPGITNDVSTLILSDYPARMISFEQGREIGKFIAAGGKLLMIGGWESFNGMGNNYSGHPVGDILPVELQSGDDRVQRTLVVRPTEHTPPDAGLTGFEPVVICGYNAAKPKKLARVLIAMSPLKYIGGTSNVALGEEIPLVTVITHGEGTVVACQTDLAPHWSGGLGDWGANDPEELVQGERLITLPTGNQVGYVYPKFLKLMLEA
ncbi:MAG TPA: glutamine amidotransferase [Candidatus Saccharimonadales bacterium]|nr:glutamine amidotransferase [Candidatus Saccharimonadales bacterium]